MHMMATLRRKEITMAQLYNANQIELGCKFRKDTEDECTAIVRDGVDVHAEYRRLVRQLHLVYRSNSAANSPNAVDRDQAA
jgi:hypothetical protein